MLKILNNKATLSLWLVFFTVFFHMSPSLGDRLYAPPYLWDRHIAEKIDPVDIANTHLGIPYRDDGAIDDQGFFTTFADPTKFFETPGLNCSGLVLSVARFLFNKNWSLQEATRDRQGNSGSNSPSGKDWDFGWDLIFNITDVTSRRVLLPDDSPVNLDSTDGKSLRGFDLHDTAAWHTLIKRFSPGRVYLGSISRLAPEQNNRLLHYHVVIIIPDKSGAAYLYHATRRSNVHRMNIATPQGLQRFLGQFRGNRHDTKKIVLVEAVLPEIIVGGETPPQTPEPGTKGPEQLKAPPPPQTQLPVPETPPPPSPPAAAPEQQGALQTGKMDSRGEAHPNARPRPVQAPESQLVISHLSGKVFRSIPGLVTHVPKFADEAKKSLRFSFQNRAPQTRNLEIYLKTPSGDVQYRGTIPANNPDFKVVFPYNFGSGPHGSILQGEYLVEYRIDGQQWCGDLFEVALPREAQPKITNVKFPPQVQTGKTFTVYVEAKNLGAESDYGGITVSAPNPAALKIVGAKQGKIYGAGSTVLSVTSDRIRTKVPMAERWIELWGEGKSYELEVQVQALKPGAYPLFIRCALRGVNVKSSVILMDPTSNDTVDQQGFPVYVYDVTVK